MPLEFGDCLAPGFGKFLCPWSWEIFMPLELGDFNAPGVLRLSCPWSLEIVIQF